MRDDYNSGPTSDDRSVVTIGEGHRVSMQVLQDIYSEITGRKESISKSYTQNHHIGFDEIRQLHTKITQLYEQYHVVSDDCSVTLYRLDDQNEVFSSFDRFEMYDRSSASPVENVNLTYNFMIVLPKISKPQSYKLSVNLHSRAAIRRRAEKEQGLPKKFLKIISGQTAGVDMEYVDYTVARNFFVTIDEWFGSLKKLRYSKFIAWLQGYSEHFPFIFRVVSTAVATLALYAASVGVDFGQLSDGRLFGLGIAAFGGVYIVGQVSFKAGQLAERFIDEYQPSSALNLNRGDEEVLGDLSVGNRGSILKSAYSIGFTIALNVAAVWLASQLGVGP